MKRLNTLIEMANWPEDEWHQNDKELYGIGTVRTTAKFFRTFGIHLETHTVENHLCRFVGKRMMDKFMPALREDGMGVDYDQIEFEFVDEWPDEKDDDEEVSGDSSDGEEDNEAEESEQQEEAEEKKEQ